MTTTIVSFVVVIGILILIHELGHFIVARGTGVGVERFSIGFGPVLLRWGGKETEYCLSVIPMGGYVKMMGEENPLEGGTGTIPYDPTKAFAAKPLWIRFLIVFAGPGMNFVLAAAIFSLVLATVGRTVWPPVIGRVEANSPAGTAGLRTGDRVMSINGRPIAHWEDFERMWSTSRGLPLEVRVIRDSGELAVSVTPRWTLVRDPFFKDAHQRWDLGVGPQLVPSLEAVNAGSPAERAGLRVGDHVVAVAGQAVFTQEELMQAIQKRPGQTLTVTVERKGRAETFTVTTEVHRTRGPGGQETEVGRIGVGIVAKALRYEPYPPWSAVWYGAVGTWDMSVITAKAFWKILTGQLPLSNLSGPLQIASETGRQAQEGIAALARFTAIISVNLAVLNLLPVPMLDGGHLFFFVIEAILGRPLSLRKREMAQQFGLVFLILIIVLALYNDLGRIGVFTWIRKAIGAT